MSKEYLWGCELNAGNREYEWTTEGGITSHSLSFSLLLKHAVLDADASNKETHIIELETMGMDLYPIRQPLVILRSGDIQQVTLDILLTHIGSKLILSKGSGPVYLWGQHIVEIVDTSESSRIDTTEFESPNKTLSDTVSSPGLSEPGSPNPKVSISRMSGQKHSGKEAEVKRVIYEGHFPK